MQGEIPGPDQEEINPEESGSQLPIENPEQTPKDEVPKQEEVYKHGLNNLLKELVGWREDDIKNDEGSRLAFWAHGQEFATTFTETLNQQSNQGLTERTKEELSAIGFDKGGLSLPFSMSGVLIRTVDKLEAKYQDMLGGTLQYFAELFYYGHQIPELNNILKIINEGRKRTILDYVAEGDKGRLAQKMLIIGGPWEKEWSGREKEFNRGTHRHLNEQIGKITHLQERLREKSSTPPTEASKT